MKMFRKTKFCLPGIFYLVLVFLLQSFLPAWTGDENSLFENIQLVVLAGGLVYSYKMLNNPLPDWGGSQKCLWLASCVYFFTLCYRELSYGRALFTHPDGSFYQYSDMGLYGQLVHPIVAALIILILFLLYKAKIWKFLQLVKLSIQDFSLLLIYIYMGWLAEKGSWLWFRNTVAEEMSELGVYLMMVYMVYEMVKVARTLKPGQKTN